MIRDFKIAAAPAGRRRTGPMIFSCRSGCGACCIAPSIATPFAGMPRGKLAGERCVHLDEAFRCRLFGQPERPSFCRELKAEPAMCGDSAAAAMAILSTLERDTRPNA